MCRIRAGNCPAPFATPGCSATCCSEREKPAHRPLGTTGLPSRRDVPDCCSRTLDRGSPPWLGVVQRFETWLVPPQAPQRREVRRTLPGKSSGRTSHSLPCWPHAEPISRLPQWGGSWFKCLCCDILSEYSSARVELRWSLGGIRCRVSWRR